MIVHQHLEGRLAESPTDPVRDSGKGARTLPSSKSSAYRGGTAEEFVHNERSALLANRRPNPASGEVLSGARAPATWIGTRKEQAIAREALTGARLTFSHNPHTQPARLARAQYQEVSHAGTDHAHDDGKVRRAGQQL